MHGWEPTKDMQRFMAVALRMAEVLDGEDFSTSVMGAAMLLAGVLKSPRGGLAGWGEFLAFSASAAVAGAVTEPLCQDGACEACQLMGTLVERLRADGAH